MKYQTINAALAAIISGEPVESVAADIHGQMDYAINYYSCEAHEVAAMRALRDAYTSTPATAPKSSGSAAMKICGCGCKIPVALAMSASFGTSCPDCYDRMSA